MGIEFSYLRITAVELEQILADPAFGERLIYGSSSDEQVGYMNDDGEYVDDLELYISNLAKLESSGRYLDIGKDWQAIHFLLTGEFCFEGQSEASYPFCKLIMNGIATEIDAGDGCVRYLAPAEVKDLSEALGQLTLEEVGARYNHTAFNQAKVYPARESWTANDINYLLEVYDQIVKLFDDAALSGDAILMWNH